MKAISKLFSFLAAICLLIPFNAWAQGPQSDDWTTGSPRPFWTLTNIGDAAVDYGGNQITVNTQNQLIMKSAGRDSWGTNNDGIAFLHQTVSGNFQITVRFNSGLGVGADPFAKAGIMIRNSTGTPTGAANAFLFASPQRPGVFWEVRGRNGTRTNLNQFILNTPPPTPIWLRLTRLNTSIIASYSTDGINFLTRGSPVDTTQLGTWFNDLGANQDPIQVGIATTGHNSDPTKIATANFGPFTATSIPTGTITGTVPGVFGANVEALDSNNRVFGHGTVGLNSQFTIDAPAGNYRVLIFNNVDNVEDRNSLSKSGVTVTAGQTTTVDFSKVAALPQISLGSNVLGATAWKVATNVSPSDYAAGAMNFDDSSFTSVNVPGELIEQGINFNSSTSHFVYRARLDVPQSLRNGKDLILSNLAVINGAAKVFFNGQDLGSYTEARETGGWPFAWTVRQKYVIPANLVQATGNVLATFGRQTFVDSGILPHPPMLHAMYENHGVLRGKLTSGGNMPQGAKVFLRSAYGYTYATTLMSGTINGNYLFGPVAPGNYKVFATNSSDASVITDVTITAGETQAVNLTLAPYHTFSWSTSSSDTTVSAKLIADINNPRLVDPSDWAPAQPAYNDTAWNNVSVPRNLGDGQRVPSNSAFWYRIKFALPASFQGAQGRLIYLTGFNIDDTDITFVNGHYVGHTSTWSTVRNYIVPSELLNWSGENVIAILGKNGYGGAGMDLTLENPTLRTASTLEGGVYGKVVTQTGGEAGGVTVTLQPASGDPLTTQTSPINGSYQFTNVAPGNYTLTVGAQPPVSLTVEGGMLTQMPNTTHTGSGFGPANLTAVNLNTLALVNIGTTDTGSLLVGGESATLTAGGEDIWNNRDAFSFAKAPTQVSGNFTAVVKAYSPIGTNEWAKAGIMVRTSDVAGARNVYAMEAFVHGLHLQWRSATNGFSFNDGDRARWMTQPGNQIMLTRSSDTFSMFLANSDGSHAFLVNEETLTGFPKNLTLGLAATSHAAGVLGDARFSDFKVSNKGWSLAGEVIDPDAFCRGDVDGNTTVTIADALAALRHLIRVETLLESRKLKAANATDPTGVNTADRLNINDVVLILRVALGFDATFPINCPL